MKSGLKGGKTVITEHMKEGRLTGIVKTEE
jgi:hypothetical protein